MKEEQDTNHTKELYSSSESFFAIYPEFDISKLPAWVAENITVAHVYGNSKKGIILPDGRKYHLDNNLNDLTGKEWTFFINSVFFTRYPTNGKYSYAHNIRKIHPELHLPIHKTLCGDAITLLKDNSIINELTDGKQISLLLLDPPYSNMMSKEKTGADIYVYGKVATPFSISDQDLGNMDRSSFLTKLRESVELALPYIKKRGYIVIFIKDLQPSKKEPNLLHSEVINTLNEIPNLYYKGLKIWADETAKLYPYGYPFCFVANQIHQYILIFRKEK